MFDVMLNMTDVDFVEQLRDALGLKPGEQMTIITPQFERSDGCIVTYFPRTVEEFDALKKLPDKTLMKIGLGVWDEGHYLFPKEWYWNIPNGYIVTDINGKSKPFIPGKTDDDIRFGMLAYGFKRHQS